MKIAVLAHNLHVAGGLSVGRNVIASLRRVADNHQYLIVMPTDRGYEEITFPTRSERVFYRRRYGVVGQQLFERGRLPGIVKQFEPDVIWGLGNFGLRKTGVPQGFLFHLPGMIYSSKHQPNLPWLERLWVALVRRRLCRSLPYTQIVFCQTNAAAARFRAEFGYDGTISLMPNAVSQFAIDSQAEAPTVFAQLQGKVVLFCLTKYYAHKNLEAIVHLFLKYGEQLKDVCVLFTVAADHHPRAENFLKSLEHPDLKGRLINVGPLPQKDLAAYYRHSNALILPTLMESFTATYLEAMQFDCPVLTSDLDFAHEVCGDAAVYFDPWNLESIRDAITYFRDTPGVAGNLVEKGKSRVREMFRSWDQIVAESIGQLEGLVDQSHLVTNSQTNR